VVDGWDNSQERVRITGSELSTAARAVSLRICRSNDSTSTRLVIELITTIKHGVYIQ